MANGARKLVQIPVRIVLVATSHPGNIGACARAMKTMGLRELALVRPKHFPSSEATARARGASELLEQSRVYDSLDAAIADCGLVVGASARLRGVAVPTVDPRSCAEAVWQRLPDDRVAIVFGPEQSGLTNEDLARCQMLVQIPTDAAFGSLNLAMAVQVLCYELRMTGLELARDAAQRGLSGETAEEAAQGEKRTPLATAAELEGFYSHLEQVLQEAEFLRPGEQRQLRLKLRRIFQRASLDQNEINILRGVLSALDPRRPRAHARRNEPTESAVERE